MGLTLIQTRLGPKSLWNDYFQSALLKGKVYLNSDLENLICFMMQNFNSCGYVNVSVSLTLLMPL